MANLLLFNKPFNVLSQFTSDAQQTTLSHFINSQDTKGFYPAGRLDYDSEGLLLLTNDGQLQHRIAHPDKKMEKTYWVQVEGNPSLDQIESLIQGVELKDGKTKPAKAKTIEEPALWPRNPPIRKRENIETAWLELTISEGKNRQVRRMTAAVDLPTLRLVRVKIGPWHIKNLKPGEFELTQVNLPAKTKRKSPERRKSHSSLKTKT